MADVSSVVNHFITAQEGFTTTTSGSVASGAATVGLNSVSGYTNGDIVALVVDPTDATKKQVFTGVVDTAGVQITGVKWTEGTNQTHLAGATVVDYTTATHQAALVKGMTAAGINQAGTMTPKVATSINDTNGNEIIKTPATASAVNEITVTNAATGNAPSISATGGDSAVHLNLRGKGLAKTVTIGAGAATIFPYDFVLSGCVWTADAAGSTLLASMTAGVVVINGNPVTVAAVTGRAFTASKDVYVDVLDNGDGTGLLVYTDGTLNAASPALASNSVRIAIIVTGASSIATVGSVNQGQEDKVLPIASSIPYAVTDSLGNLICPRDPNRRRIGYRQLVSAFTSGGTADADITGLSAVVSVPSGRSVKAMFYAPQAWASVDGNRIDFGIQCDGTDIQRNYNRTWATGNGGNGGIVVQAEHTPTAGTHTYKMRMQTGIGAGVGTVYGAATSPVFLVLELT